MSGTTKLKGRNPVIVLLIVAAIIGIAAVAYAITEEPARMATQPVAVPEAQNRQQLAQVAEGVTSGDPNARITIMEFADYSCPHCRAFEDQIKPLIDSAYIQTGKAKFVFHDYVLGGFPHSFLAARAARCAGDQQKYMEYHDALFANQATWSIAPTAPVDQLIGYAEQLGLERDGFKSCLESDKHAVVVSANRELATQLNLPGTPSVLIKTAGPTLPIRIEHPDPWLGISQVVDSILGVSQPTPQP